MATERADVTRSDRLAEVENDIVRFRTVRGLTNIIVTIWSGAFENEAIGRLCVCKRFRSKRIDRIFAKIGKRVGQRFILESILKKVC